MSTSPQVSIIIPTHNRPDLLERAIASVRHQTVTDWEILVVDDASNHPEINESLVDGLADRRIRYLNTGTNRMLPGARNFGIDHANGAYLAFLDDDDEWLPSKLEKQLAFFSKSTSPHLGAVVTKLQVDSYSGRSTPSRQVLLHGNSYERILKTLTMQTSGSSLLVKREVVDSGLRYDEDFRAFEDWDFLVRIARHFDISTVDDVLVTKHEDFIGTHVWNPANSIQGRERILSKHGAEMAKHPPALRRAHIGLAGVLARSGDLAKAEHHLRLAASEGSFSLGLYFAKKTMVLGPSFFNRFYALFTADDKLKRAKERVLSLPRIRF